MQRRYRRKSSGFKRLFGPEPGKKIAWALGTAYIAHLFWNTGIDLEKSIDELDRRHSQIRTEDTRIPPRYEQSDSTYVMNADSFKIDFNNQNYSSN